MDNNYYLDRLYPFQDEIIRLLMAVDTEFYLTGGTALSRGYLHHRFSDDLDYFINDDDRFSLWADRIIDSLTRSSKFQIDVLQREARYVRISTVREGIDLKVEMVNDVPSRVGEPVLHPVLGRLDTSENILANKVTAVLDRAAPKDLADIWGLCCVQRLSLEEAISGAQGKAAGVFAADLARVLCSVTYSDWELVRWIDPPEADRYIKDLVDLGNNLIIPR